MRDIVGHIYDLYTLTHSTTLCHIYYIIAAAGSRKKGNLLRKITLYHIYYMAAAAGSRRGKKRGFNCLRNYLYN